MKRKWVFILIFLSTGFAFAQNTKRVGINTPTPNAILDVEGTVRITEPGISGISGSGGVPQKETPLGINPNTKKLEKLDFVNSPPVQYIKRTIPLNIFRGVLGQDVDLGVDARRYTVILLSGRPKIRGRLRRNESRAPFMKIMSISDFNNYGLLGNAVPGTNRSPDNSVVGTALYIRPLLIEANRRTRIASDEVLVGTNGKPYRIALQGKTNTGGGVPTRIERNVLMIPTLNIEVYVNRRRGVWHFKGGLGAGSFLEESLEWELEYLVIDNKWVRVTNKTINVR